MASVVGAEVRRVDHCVTMVHVVFCDKVLGVVVVWFHSVYQGNKKVARCLAIS